MDTADVPINAEAVPTTDEADTLWIGIDVTLVDGLLAFLGRRRFITRRHLVLATATLARASYYAAEGFVTDLGEWSMNPSDEVVPVAPLIDALLDLRGEVAFPCRHHGLPS